MSVQTRIASFVTGLVIIFGLALFVGQAAGPDVDRDRHDAVNHGRGHEQGHEQGHGRGDRMKHGHGMKHGPGKLAGSGYSLQLEQRRLDRGAPIRFRIVDRDGRTVTAYDTRHERDLHLILVGVPGLTEYAHLHPTLDSDGVWTARNTLAPGRYVVYADAQPSGADPLVLRTRLVVTGRHRPSAASMPAPSSTQEIGPYAVTLDADTEGEAAFTVTRNGEPVANLQNYLGAYGHLVVIRANSLDYVHAHPQRGSAGPDVTFDVEFDRPGRYRLFFEFRHGDTVRTAAFTQRVTAGEHDGD